MIINVYDSIIKDTILFYIQIPQNIINETTQLCMVDINITFIPSYGIDVKRLISSNKYVKINNEKNTVSIGELYDSTSVYIVAELKENKMYDKFIALDDTRLAVDTSYYDVKTCKKTNNTLTASFTSLQNDSFETIISDIKKGNRAKIKPCTNVLVMSDSSCSDDLEIFT